MDSLVEQRFVKRFYQFLSACGGSWRNTIFVSCPEPEHTPGFLMAMDRDGCPVILPVPQFHELTGEQIDPAECRGQLTQDAFQDIYAQYLIWRLPENSSRMPSDSSPSSQ